MTESAGKPPLPPATFQTLVAMLASQAMHALGLMAEEGQPTPPPEPEQAKFLIDLLGILEEKTRATVTDEEARMLRGVLTDLRMAYVKAR